MNAPIRPAVDDSGLTTGQRVIRKAIVWGIVFGAALVDADDGDPEPFGVGNVRLAFEPRTPNLQKQNSGCPKGSPFSA
jgi:hypothetical protein